MEGRQETFQREDATEIPSEHETQDLESAGIERKLLHSVFSGSYLDRCWIEPIKTYRDRIRVDLEEESFSRSLKSTLRKLKKGSKGIAAHEFYSIERDGDTLYVYVDWSKQSHVFGHYWFLIEHVEMIKPQNSLTFNIKVLRPISSRDFSDTSKCIHCGKLQVHIPDGDPLNFSEIARDWINMVQPALWWKGFITNLSAVNVINGIKFMVLLMAALITGGASLSVKLLTIINKTIHELGYLVHQATPLLLGFLEMLSRCIGGFLLLISTIWRDFWRPPAQQPPPPSNIRPIGYLDKEQTYPYQRKNIQRPYFSLENK